MSAHRWWKLAGPPLERQLEHRLEVQFAGCRISQLTYVLFSLNYQVKNKKCCQGKKEMNSLFGQRISKCWNWPCFPSVTPCFFLFFLDIMFSTQMKKTYFRPKWVQQMRGLTRWFFHEEIKNIIALIALWHSNFPCNSWGESLWRGQVELCCQSNGQMNWSKIIKMYVQQNTWKFVGKSLCSDFVSFIQMQEKLLLGVNKIN